MKGEHRSIKEMRGLGRIVKPGEVQSALGHLQRVVVEAY